MRIFFICLITALCLVSTYGEIIVNDDLLERVKVIAEGLSDEPVSALKMGGVNFEKDDREIAIFPDHERDRLVYFTQFPCVDPLRGKIVLNKTFGRESRDDPNLKKNLYWEFESLTTSRLRIGGECRWEKRPNDATIRSFLEELVTDAALLNDRVKKDFEVQLWSELEKNFEVSGLKFINGEIQFFFNSQFTSLSISDDIGELMLVCNHIMTPKSFDGILEFLNEAVVSIDMNDGLAFHQCIKFEKEEDFDESIFLRGSWRLEKRPEYQGASIVANVITKKLKDMHLSVEKKFPLNVSGDVIFKDVLNKHSFDSDEMIRVEKMIKNYGSLLSKEKLELIKNIQARSLPRFTTIQQAQERVKASTPVKYDPNNPAHLELEIARIVPKDSLSETLQQLTQSLLRTNDIRPFLTAVQRDVNDVIAVAQREGKPVPSLFTDNADIDIDTAARNYARLSQLTGNHNSIRELVEGIDELLDDKNAREALRDFEKVAIRGDFDYERFTAAAKKILQPERVASQTRADDEALAGVRKYYSQFGEKYKVDTIMQVLEFDQKVGKILDAQKDIVSDTKSHFGKIDPEKAEAASAFAGKVANDFLETGMVTSLLHAAAHDYYKDIAGNKKQK